MNHSFVMNRRQACHLLAAGPWAVSRLQAASNEGSRPFQLRYILASSLYGQMPLEEILPEVAKTGAECIDLWPKHHANQREQVEAMGHDRFAELLDRHRVRLGMTTRYDLGPFGLTEELKFLRRFKAALVVTGSQGPPDLSGAACRAAVRRFLEQMKPHVAAAEEHGVTIAVENHGRALVSTPDSLRYFAELSPSPRLGIALAPYHLPQDENLLVSLIADLGPKLVHFYAWQYGEGCTKPMPKELELRQMPGRGKLDFRALLAALAQSGYAGFVEVFMHPTPRGIPILPTIDHVTQEVNRCRGYLERCLVRPKTAATQRDQNRRAAER